MPPLPIISGKQVVKAFEKDGWIFDMQHGSHMILTKPGMQGIHDCSQITLPLVGVFIVHKLLSPIKFHKQIITLCENVYKIV